MAEALLNWAVMLALMGLLGLFVLVAWWDLKGDTQARPVAQPPYERSDPAQAPLRRTAALLYQRNGAVAFTQSVDDSGPVFIGTEVFPELGPGFLVRQVRVSWNGAGLVAENRDPNRPVRWTRLNGDTGEAATGELLPIEDGTALQVGEWTITCRVPDGAE